MLEYRYQRQTVWKKGDDPGFTVGKQSGGWGGADMFFWVTKPKCAEEGENYRREKPAVAGHLMTGASLHWKTRE